MKRIWQKTKKATAFLLTVMLIAAMCPMSMAAETEVYEYLPGSMSGTTTFTSAVSHSASSTPLTIALDNNGSCISVRGMRYDRMKAAADAGGGHAQYNAFRITVPTAGEYTLSFKNAASDETVQKISAAPAIYFFKAEDDHKTLNAYYESRAPYLGKYVDLTADIIGYFNFAEASPGKYTTFMDSKGKAVVLKVTEPGDYYIAFSYESGTLERAGHFRYTQSGSSVVDRATALANIKSNSNMSKNYYLELHIGGIKLEKLSSGDDAAETVPTSLSYIVRAEDSANNSKITVSDNNYTVNGTNVGEWAINTEFTATAYPDGFAYWANGNGTPVSESPSYTFTPKSNFVLEAVYTSAGTTTKKVQFWNYNKVYLDEVTATADTLGDKMIENPTLNGWSFAKWTTDGNDTFDASTALTAAITRVVAQFTKNDKPFTVDGATYSYDDTFAKTAADTDETNAFSYWTIDGQVASYDKTLSFNVWDSVGVAAVYEGAKEAVPTVVLDMVDHTDAPDEYFIHYEVPAGYTPVDAGIVFGTSGSTPRVDSHESKASVKQAGAKGQFTAAPGEDTHIAARGYVMYKDSEENYRIIYSAVK